MMGACLPLVCVIYSIGGNYILVIRIYSRVLFKICIKGKNIEIKNFIINLF